MAFYTTNPDSIDMEIHKEVHLLIAMVEDYLAGKLSASSVVGKLKAELWEFEDGLPSQNQSEQDRTFKDLFWSTVLLDEPESHRTSAEELSQSLARLRKACGL